MDELIIELKKRLIDVLNLEEMQPEDIDADAPLFGEGLGLDSIDVLELIVMMEKVYGIKIKDPSAGKDSVESVRTIAAFVEANRTK